VGDPPRPALHDRLAERRARHLQRGHVKRTAVVLAGFAVVIVGVLLLVLPGPGVALIAAGLALLALEFAWAERLLGAALRRGSRRGRRRPR